jgi:hypothetical protein
MLSLVTDMLQAKHGRRYTIDMVRNDPQVETRDFKSNLIIAEFMLNPLPLQVLPSTAALES